MKNLLQYIKLVIPFILVTTMSCNTQQKDSNLTNEPQVKIAGALRNVMMKGQLQGTIYLDSIKAKSGLLGVGPEEFLKSEITVVDGKSYRSVVLTSTTMKVSETYELKAPFFVYSNVTNWRTEKLPKNINDVGQLDSYLQKISKNANGAFAFN